MKSTMLLAWIVLKYEKIHRKSKKINYIKIELGN